MSGGEGDRTTDPENPADRTDDEPVAVPAHPARVAAGVLGLMFGLLAVGCLVLGCAMWGATWYGVGPLAGLGVLFALGGRGWARIAGLTVGLPLAALGTAFLVALANRP
jgi:hypothetical protein